MSTNLPSEKKVTLPIKIERKLRNFTCFFHNHYHRQSARFLSLFASKNRVLHESRTRIIKTLHFRPTEGTLVHAYEISIFPRHFNIPPFHGIEEHQYQPTLPVRNPQTIFIRLSYQKTKLSTFFETGSHALWSGKLE